MLNLYTTEEMLSLRDDKGDTLVIASRVDGKMNNPNGIFPQVDSSEGVTYGVTIKTPRTGYKPVDLLSIAAFLVSVAGITNPELMDDLEEEFEGEGIAVLDTPRKLKIVGTDLNTGRRKVETISLITKSRRKNVSRRKPANKNVAKRRSK